MLWYEICMALIGFAMVFFGAGAITVFVFRVGSKVMFPPRLGRFLYRMHKFPGIVMDTSRADTFRALGQVKNGRFENGIFLDSRRSRRMDYNKAVAMLYTQNGGNHAV